MDGGFNDFLAAQPAVSQPTRIDRIDLARPEYFDLTLSSSATYTPLVTIPYVIHVHMRVVESGKEWIMD